jgi:hypothetical protein
MPESPDDGRRLLARGHSITLADGAVHQVSLRNRHLTRIEDDYGSLDEFAEALRRKPFNGLAYVIGLTLGVSKDEAIDLVNTQSVRQDLSAIGDAIAEALGSGEVSVRILQNHEIEGDRYRAGSEVSVTAERARHLLEARVAELVSGNGKAAPEA